MQFLVARQDGKGECVADHTDGADDDDENSTVKAIRLVSRVSGHGRQVVCIRCCLLEALNMDGYEIRQKGQRAS